ncbi:hypothetical protein ONE63_006358 [Megalurothrips usitatus]|uniref:Uncharacterized protein n=1 Tax=Megalurothrips usitatus TaxID=439358 RepID=A0AAV7XXA5_9NEOP|nr:hypothetical protein ONE63_006358 [Megalurothrips usitatus]
MTESERAPRAAWYRLKLRRYTIKERPKSLVFGKYRKLDQLDQDTEVVKKTQRKSMHEVPYSSQPKEDISVNRQNDEHGTKTNTLQGEEFSIVI